MICPDLLVSKVYKACYFPNSSYLNASLGSTPSYIWSSRHSVQSLFKNGSRIRIGSRISTTIWRTPWLVNASDPYVQTVAPLNLHNITVDQLMVSGTSHWDVDLVSNLF